MRIIRLKANPREYTCNTYLVLGDQNSPHAINTIIDPGADGYVLQELDTVSTGIGKKRLEQVLLTHNHFDHSGGVKAVCSQYDVKVLAFTKEEGIDEKLYGGEELLAGDRRFLVLHTPGHSSDSLCFYFKEEGILFSGDTQLIVQTPGGAYPYEFKESLEKLAALDIRFVYPGHGGPFGGDIASLLAATIRNVGHSNTLYPRDLEKNSFTSLPAPVGGLKLTTA